MIRRREGEHFWLIRQTDHARLAGEMARAYGNAHFAAPDPPGDVITAVARHDGGWPYHDDAPARSPAGHPLDVFETPRHIAHQIWSESSRRACEIGPYVGLLVSLHQLGLSAISASAAAGAPHDAQQLRQQFDTNKFQHAMIERTEALRLRLGLRTDRPLRLGLAEGWTDPAEQALAHHLRLLQALDQISLAICCETPPMTSTGPLLTRPGGSTTSLRLRRPSADALLVRPWPFAAASLPLRVPYRAVPARAYESDAALAAAIAAAPTDELRCTLRPG
ncbi:MAG TPA: DUF3891 family protein [Tepidisphaeraceae bacterium]|jgi:hypothetical protein